MFKHDPDYHPDTFRDRGESEYPEYRGNVREPDPQRPTFRELTLMDSHQARLDEEERGEGMVGERFDGQG